MVPLPELTAQASTLLVKSFFKLFLSAAAFGIHRNARGFSREAIITDFSTYGVI